MIVPDQRRILAAKSHVDLDAFVRRELRHADPGLLATWDACIVTHLGVYLVPTGWKQTEAAYGISVYRPAAGDWPERHVIAWVVPRDAGLCLGLASAEAVAEWNISAAAPRPGLGWSPTDATSWARLRSPRPPSAPGASSEPDPAGSPA